MRAPAIRNLRWWIGGLLFASTVINYVDRQTLSLLAPFLKQDFHWTNADYANLLIGFRFAYSIGQTVCGRLGDRVGTRRGLSVPVLLYSIVSISTSLARGFYSFALFRFLLGASESANWPGATKQSPNGFRGAREVWQRRYSIVGRQSAERCSIFDPGNLFSLGMAAGLCTTGFAGIRLADGLAQDVLPAGSTPAYWRE